MRREYIILRDPQHIQINIENEMKLKFYVCVISPTKRYMFWGRFCANEGEFSKYTTWVLWGMRSFWFLLDDFQKI
jgi:hypothetical protein